MHATIIALEHVFCIQNIILNGNFCFCMRVFVPFSIRQFSMVFSSVLLHIVSLRFFQDKTQTKKMNDWKIAENFSMSVDEDDGSRWVGEI